MKFCRYHVFMRAFFEIQGLLVFTCSDTGIKFLSCLILMRTFQNWPNELHSISGSEKTSFFDLVFMQFLSLVNNCWNNQNQETYPAWSLLLILNISKLWCKNISCMRYWNVATYRKCLRNYSGYLKSLSGYYMVFMNYLKKFSASIFNDTHREKTYFTQFSTRMASSLLLTFS